MINRIAPVGLMLAIACNGGDGIAPTPVSNDISTMAVGEVRAYLPSDLQDGLNLPTVTSARDYVVIVGNTSTAHDIVANYVVNANISSGAAFGISVPSELSAQSAIAINRIPLARTGQEALDNRVRAFERRYLALRSPSGPSGNSRLSPRMSTQVGAAAVPAVGDRINLKIPDASVDSLLCDNFFTTQAVVASVSTRAILAVDTLDGPPLLLFTQAQMDSITSEFDNVTYPTDAAYFGTPTDVDANAGHIIILFTGQVNKLTPPNNPPDVGYTVGFFFAGDFFPPTGPDPNTICPASNQAEIFYLLSPDPTGRFGNVRTTSSVRQGVRGTIAHEFQHMINAGNRFLNPAVRSFESTWLDEALAHFAEDAVGRVQRGFTDLRTLTFNDVLPCSPCSEANDYDAFFFQNLAKLSQWMNNPDLYSPTSKLADTSLATRGAAWAIVRYVADNYSNGNPRALTRNIAGGPDTGVKNFAAATQASIDTLVKGWLVANYADQLVIPGLDQKYRYRSYNFRSVLPPVAKSVLNQPSPNGTYPLSVQAIGTGSDNLAGKNRSGTGTYYRLNVPANSGAKNVQVSPTFIGEHVYVLRVQ